MKLFSSLDLEFIQRSLGRKPGQSELKILYRVLEPVLTQREKIPTRFVQQIGTTDQNVQIEIRNVTDTGKWASAKYLIRDCVLQGFWPAQVSFVWLFHPTKACLNRIHDTETTLTKHFAPAITHHASQGALRKKSGKVIVIAIMNKEPYSRKVTSGQLLGYVKIPKPGKTLMNEKRIMKVLSGYDRFVSGISLLGNYGDDLHHLLSAIPRTTSIELDFPEKYKKGDGLIISEGVSDYELKNKFSDCGYEYQRIGKIKNDLQHNLYLGDGHKMKWPLVVTQISIHGKEDKLVVTEKAQTPLKKKKARKPNVLQVLKVMIAGGHAAVGSDKLLDDGSGRNVEIVGNEIGQSSAHSLFHGSRSVADVVRKLAVKGSDIESIDIISNVDNPQFLAGQQSVIHTFGLRQISKNNFINDLLPGQHQVIGIGNASTIIENLIVESDFISLLGSIKGELGISLYQELTGLHSDDNEPVFDSTMEYNINQTLIQAVSSSVVKTVTNISKGGLAIALLKMYLNMKCEFGMKIHISRRLTPEELLFGESFGSALVLVGEKELMEFQRICMVHGIPCSTIGRLQPKKEITVNDLLKIRENFLSTLSP